MCAPLTASGDVGSSGPIRPGADDGGDHAVQFQLNRRYQAQGLDGLRDRSKRPLVSPNATRTEVVGKIYLRQHYHLGPARIAMYLKRYHDIQLGPSGVRWRLQRSQTLG